MKVGEVVPQNTNKTLQGQVTIPCSASAARLVVGLLTRIEDNTRRLRGRTFAAKVQSKRQTGNRRTVTLHTLETLFQQLKHMSVIPSNDGIGVHSMYLNVSGAVRALSPTSDLGCGSITEQQDGFKLDISDVGQTMFTHVPNSQRHLVTVDYPRINRGKQKLPRNRKSPKDKRWFVSTFTHINANKRSMLPGLRRYEDLVRHIQSPLEKVEVKAVGTYVRAVRTRYGLRREQLAGLIGLDVEIIVIVENGDGNSNTARRLFDRVKRLRTTLK